MKILLIMYTFMINQLGCMFVLSPKTHLSEVIKTKMVEEGPAQKPEVCKMSRSVFEICDINYQ